MANSQHEEHDPNHAKMSTEISISTNSTDTTHKPNAVNTGNVITCLIPTFADACRLVNTPYSCLVLDTHRRHVALPPMYLKKKNTGIREELDAELLKYSENLKGVPLAYGNLKLLGNHGDIFDDQGYIHVNIEASFVVFQPKKGQKLEGVVSKLGLTYVGCLVHGCFNASILKPKELSTEMWRDSGLTIGESLEFQVLSLDADAAGVLLIRGKLSKSWCEKFNQTDPETDQAMTEDITATDTAVTEADPDQPDAPLPKKKKKKSKSKDKETFEDPVTNNEQTINTEQTESNITDSNNHSNSPGVEEETKKKKKKKKDKSREREEVDIPSTTDLPGSDSSGYSSDKGKRKRKEANEKMEAAPTHSEEPKAKKKKNK